MNNQTNEPVAWILQTGHGTVIEKVKPVCEIDYWKPLAVIEPNTITITESEYAKLKADADLLDELQAAESVNDKSIVCVRKAIREAIDQAIKEST